MNTNGLSHSFQELGVGHILPASSAQGFTRLKSRCHLEAWWGKDPLSSSLAYCWQNSFTCGPLMKVPIFLLPVGPVLASGPRGYLRVLTMRPSPQRGSLFLQSQQESISNASGAHWLGHSNDQAMLSLLINSKSISNLIMGVTTHHIYRFWPRSGRMDYTRCVFQGVRILGVIVEFHPLYLPWIISLGLGLRNRSEHITMAWHNIANFLFQNLIPVYQ